MSKVFLAFMVLGILVVIACLGAVGYVVHLAASAPPLSSLKARAIAENSRVYAADGTSLGFIQNDELHLPLKRSDIPQVVRDATIAIEDERFYKHNGVDYEGVVRAAVNNLNSDSQQGGSTITMQLVRSLYISNEKTYTRKIREAKLAEELEDEHSKEWILERYLDSIPYGTVGGQSAIGIKAAAKIYFSKELKDLNVREAALLAGIPQATDTYSPVRNPKAAKGRRNEVLGKMAELGMISPEQARKASSKGLGVTTSQYFTKRREHYFFDYVKDQLFREYGALTVRTGGLKVYTTIDLKKQEEARATIESHLAGIGPSSAIVTIDPRTGYIEAMASSGDYGQSNFNLAAQGHRRPGSTFKVMALMTALRMGVDPDRTSYTSVSPTVLDDPAYGHIDIKTYSGSGGGTMTLRRGTLQSDNSVYIQLALDLGPGRGRQDRAGHGHQVDAQGLPGRDARRPRERRLADGDGDRLRVDRQRRPARPPDGDHEDQVPGRPRGEGRLAAAALPRQAHPDLLRRRRGQGDGDPPAEPVERHRRPGVRLHVAVPRGRQDRHRRRQHGRLVRGLHAAHVDLRLGRLPRRRARLHELPVLRRAGRRRHVPGGDLGRLHEPRQGLLLRRLRAAQGAVRLLAVLRPLRELGRQAHRGRRPRRRDGGVHRHDDARERRTPRRARRRPTGPTTTAASTPARTSRRRRASPRRRRRRPPEPGPGRRHGRAPAGLGGRRRLRLGLALRGGFITRRVEAAVVVGPCSGAVSPVEEC